MVSLLDDQLEVIYFLALYTVVHGLNDPSD